LKLPAARDGDRPQLFRRLSHKTLKAVGEDIERLVLQQGRGPSSMNCVNTIQPAATALVEGKAIRPTAAALREAVEAPVVIDRADDTASGGGMLVRDLGGEGFVAKQPGLRFDRHWSPTTRSRCPSRSTARSVRI
jgi:leucyl-tRNA synthetase